MDESIDLHHLLGEHRDLFVTALQALWRERRAALNAATDVADLSNTTPPNKELFGIDEISDMLRRVGAAPHA